MHLFIVISITLIITILRTALIYKIREKIGFREVIMIATLSIVTFMATNFAYILIIIAFGWDI